MSARTRQEARMLEATRPVRILDNRTSGEIISSMERRIASPEYAAERAAFYADVATRDAAERAKQEALWAADHMETINAHHQ